MEILEFLLGDEHFPVYRTVTDRESEMLRALLGEAFHFELAEGEPLDDLLFDVLAGVTMRADFFFAPPPESSLVGTFELRDVTVPQPAAGHPGRVPARPRVH